MAVCLGLCAEGVHANTAELVAATQGQALPDLVAAMERARDAGLPASKLLAMEDVTKARAAADLRLLSEVLSVAGAAVANAPAEVREAFASGGKIHIGRIKEAFSMAERTGVPESERTVAWNMLKSEVSKRMAAAIKVLEATATPTTVAIRNLGHLIGIAHSIGSDPAEVTRAQAAYSAQLSRCADLMAHCDLDYIDEAVKYAAEARVPAPEGLRHWMTAHTMLHHASALDEDETSNLPTFMTAISKASEMQLPPSHLLEKVQGKARVCADIYLQQTLAKEENATDPKHIGELRVALESAKKMSANGTFAGSAAKITTLASSGVTKALSADLDAAQVSQAFEVAELAGVPDVPSKKTTLETDVLGRLGAAKAAATASPSAATMEDLAKTISLAYKLASDKDLVAAAQRVYESNLQGTFNASDMAFLENVVKFAPLARVKVPAAAQALAASQTAVRAALALPPGGDEAGQAYALALQRAQQDGLPRTPELIDLESKAREAALATLSATLAKESNNTAPAHLPELLASLEAAKKAGVPESSLAATRSKIQAIASAGLQQAANRDLDDPVSINQALETATLAGLDASATSTAVTAKARARLTAASGAAKAKQTAETIRELARAIFSAHKLQLPKTEVAAARAHFLEQLEGPFGVGEVPFVEAAAASAASHARVQPPETVARWAQAQTKLRAATAVPDASRDALTKTLEAIAMAKSVGLPYTQELATAESKARILASANLDQVSSGESAAVVQEGVATAVEVGIPEDDLDSATVVSGAVDTAL